MTLPGLGGSLRAVGDIGSHWLDLAGFVGGRRIEAATADLTTVLPTRLRPLSTSTGTFSEPLPAQPSQTRSTPKTLRVSSFDLKAARPPTAPDYPTFDDGLEQAVVADAIAKSARERQWVSVERSNSA